MNGCPVKQAAIAAILLCGFLLSAAGQSWAQTAPAAPASGSSVNVELNKLEQTEGADSCRLYLLLDNPTADDYQSLRLDLVFFDTGGVIVRRLAVDAAPLRPKRRQVKLFDVAGMTCAKMGQILVNDVLACRDAAGNERTDCLDRVAVSSRVPAVTIAK